LLALRFYQVESKVQKAIIVGLLKTLEKDWKSLSLEVRIEVNEALGELGDPRLTAMVSIPGGNFMAGEEPNQMDISVDSFEIAKYPVTNVEYQRFVDATGHRAPTGWQNGHFPLGRSNHPVTHVSLEDAKAYLEWAGLRLPREIEWEKAARGTAGNVYPWGNDADVLKCNLWESGLGGTTPVGLYPDGISPYGVADMIGNVWEWVLSKENQASRVLRGGSWNTLQANVQASTRYTDPPPHLLALVGFRCAR
jgi:formylglycine-generating enzyme required for sulfatase activity